MARTTALLALLFAGAGFFSPAAAQPSRFAFGFVSGPVAAPTAYGVTISWESEQPGDGEITYSTSPNLYEAIDLLAATDGAQIASHSVTYPGPGSVPLQPSTQYFYLVRSVNADGNNVAQSDILTFTTLPPPAPPRLTIVSPANNAVVQDSQAEILWDVTYFGDTQPGMRLVRFVTSGLGQIYLPTEILPLL